MRGHAPPAVRAALLAAGATVGAEVDPGLHLQHDLGIDSLALLDVVESLQSHLGVTIGDEDISRLATVGDLILLVQAYDPQPYSWTNDTDITEP